ncbi:hypothetical protein Tco_1563857 [Tanacetum coccineum]
MVRSGTMMTSDPLKPNSSLALIEGYQSKILSCEPTVSSLNDEIDFRISFDDSDDEDYTAKVCFLCFILGKLVSKDGYDVLDMALPPRELRHPFLRYEGLQYTEADIEDFETRLSKIYRREVHRVQVVLVSIVGRSQAPKKVTVTDLFYLRGIDILGELTVIAPELLIIDMGELVRLQIYMKVDDTWAWVAIGLERQPHAVAGAHGVAQDAPIVDEGGQANPEPV